MLRIVGPRLEKQLDLVKFINGQRMQMHATLMALDPHKALILEKMAIMTVRESSDLNDGSQGEAKDFEPHNVQKWLKSVSKEMKNLYKVGKLIKKCGTED